jgi:hypothetical protein
MRRSAVTSPSREYRTLASTGYIIRSRPRAIGSETVSTLTRSSVSSRPGKTRPRPIPSAIATPIHTGRKRSSVESLSMTGESSGRASVITVIRRASSARRAAGSSR